MRLLLAAVLLLSTLSSDLFAQKFGRDFTRTDCEGTPIELFNELDNGKVVILELVMLGGCTSCIIGGQNLGKLVKELNAGDRIELLAIGYNDDYTCEEMSEWRSTNALTSRVFEKGTVETSYYGGFGMPTVVVLAGEDHRVVFRKLGAPSNKDLAAIKDSITRILGLTSSVTPAQKASGYSVNPNPAFDVARFTASRGTTTPLELRLINSAGVQVWTGTMASGAVEYDLPLHGLSQGAYTLQVVGSEAAGGETDLRSSGFIQTLPLSIVR